MRYEIEVTRKVTETSAGVIEVYASDLVEALKIAVDKAENIEYKLTDDGKTAYISKEYK
jgi:hypothetical protein